jgi:hypothetical protein
MPTVARVVGLRWTDRVHVKSEERERGEGK